MNLTPMDHVLLDVYENVIINLLLYKALLCRRKTSVVIITYSITTFTNELQPRHLIHYASNSYM